MKLAMDPLVIGGLVLFIISEILPYTPLKGNGIVQALVEALKLAFPKKDPPADPE